MSDRLPKVDNLCADPGNHETHMCELRLEGRIEELKQFQKEPRFVCGNCGTAANDQGALCAPGPMDSE